MTVAIITVTKRNEEQLEIISSTIKAQSVLRGAMALIRCDVLCRKLGINKRVRDWNHQVRLKTHNNALLLNCIQPRIPHAHIPRIPSWYFHLSWFSTSGRLKLLEIRCVQQAHVPFSLYCSPGLCSLYTGCFVSSKCVTYFSRKKIEKRLSEYWFVKENSHFVIIGSNILHSLKDVRIGQNRRQQLAAWTLTGKELTLQLVTVRCVCHNCTYTLIRLGFVHRISLKAQWND